MYQNLIYEHDSCCGDHPQNNKNCGFLVGKKNMLIPNAPFVFILDLCPTLPPKSPPKKKTKRLSWCIGYKGRYVAAEWRSSDHLELRQPVEETPAVLILGKSPGKSTTLHFNSPICCSTLKWWQDWGLVRVYFCATKTKSKAKWDLSERCLLECMQFFWCMQALCRANLQSYNSP